MGNLKFLSLLFCVVAVSVDFASCLKCYRCAYTEPFFPELESTAVAVGYPYNKECGSDNPSGTNLVTGPLQNPPERTPTHLPSNTSSFMSKLVLSAMAKVPSAKVILSQLKTKGNNTVESNVNGTLIPSQATMVSHCVKSMVKLDTEKLIAGIGAGVALPPGLEIPKEITMVLRDLIENPQTINQCLNLKDLVAEMPNLAAPMEAAGVKEIYICFCINKDECNGGKVDMGDGGGGGGAGGGGASTISLGIFTTIFAMFMYSTTF